MTLILIYQLLIQLNEVNCMKLNVIFRKNTVQGKLIDKHKNHVAKLFLHFLKTKKCYMIFFINTFISNTGLRFNPK